MLFFFKILPGGHELYWEPAKLLIRPDSKLDWMTKKCNRSPGKSFDSKMSFSLSQIFKFWTEIGLTQAVIALYWEREMRKGGGVTRSRISGDMEDRGKIWIDRNYRKEMKGSILFLRKVLWKSRGYGDDGFHIIWDFCIFVSAQKMRVKPTYVCRVA